MKRPSSSLRGKFSTTRLAIAVYLLALTLWLAPTAEAQIFGPTTLVTGDRNVLNIGTTVLAYDVSNSPSSVNGVTFSGDTTNGTVAFLLAGFPNSDNNGVGSGLSTNLTNVLIDNIYNYGNSATLTLTGLTAGTNYALQLFAGTTGVGLGTMKLTDGSGMGTLSYGNDGTNSTAYDTTENFTAGLTDSETINFVPMGDSYNDNFIILDAFNLRAVPEPSTWAMLFGGVLLLFGPLRFRASRT